jgi:exopolyphosphatase/guanosine-5'-triphosphate,3'-diphosphate pyrophosphatase
MLRLQRGKFKMGLVDDMPRIRKDILLMIIVLRLAIILERSRDWDLARKVRIKRDNKKLKLKFAQEYLEKHPLTLADLKQEKIEIEKAGYRLKFK